MVIESMSRRRGHVVVVVLCLVPALLWAFAGPLGPRVAGASTTLRSMAVLLGLVGVSAFAVNLLLGARIGLVDRLFRGLDKMYDFHRALGRVAFFLLLGHALLMLVALAIDGGIGAWKVLLPGTTGWTIPLGALALVLMSSVLWLTLYARLNHEEFLWVHRVFGAVFLIGALHAFRTPGVKATSRALTYYLLILSGAGLIAWFYRSLLGEALAPRYDYEVVRVNRIDDTVTEIAMLPTDQKMRFTPGQFAYITVHSDSMRRIFKPVHVSSEGGVAEVTFQSGAVGEQAHPFSITSSPDADELIVAVKAVGDFTTAVRELQEGDRVKVEGPFGSFSYLKMANKRQLWIAGGIGVTPFLSMARSLESPDYEIDFFYSMDVKDHSYFLDELHEVADRDPRLRVIAWSTRGDMGYLTAEDVAGVIPDLSERDILLCGPPGMVTSMIDQLVDLGIPRLRMHHEAFSLTGRK